MVTERNTVLKINAAKTCEPMTAQIITESPILSANWEILDNNGDISASGNADINSHGCGISTQFDANAWSAEKPVLYTLNVNISYQNRCFTII